MLMAPEGFRYTGMRKFSRSDIAGDREFCGDCGTHLTTRRPGLRCILAARSMILVVWRASDGDPIDKQPFHVIPDGLQTFEGLPPR